MAEEMTVGLLDLMLRWPVLRICPTLLGVTTTTTTTMCAVDTVLSD